MYKVLTGFTRRPDLSRTEFQQAWSNAWHTSSCRPVEVRRHVVYKTLVNDPVSDSPESNGWAFDVVSAAWFDDHGSFLRAVDGCTSVEEAGGLPRTLLGDQAVSVVAVEENVCIEPESGELVLFEFLTRPDSIDRATFRERWLEHGSSGDRLYADGVLHGYVQNHALPDGPNPWGDDEGAWDGVAMVYYADLDEFAHVMSLPYITEDMAAEELLLMDRSRSALFIASRDTTSDPMR